MHRVITLANGVSMPIVGLGTYKTHGQETIQCVLEAAIKSGYRAFDTASVYRNEAEIGSSIKNLLPKYGLKREDIFITSKLKLKKYTKSDGNKGTNGNKTCETKDLSFENQLSYENKDETMNVNEMTPIDHIKTIEEVFSNIFLKYGLEYSPFKVGWYNEQVSKFFQLPYHPDSIAYVIISTPTMFENAFLPFVEDDNCLRSTIDPLDQCMKYHFNLVKEKLPQYTVDAIHDFEITPMKRPKVLVQTAGHVAGAVRYYQRKDLVLDPWPPSKKMFGVCIHPQYGGWMALRGVVIFSDLQCPHLLQKQPCEILETQEEIQELLRRFNECWQDWSFRDIINVKEKYSELQQEYFSTNPADRKKILDRLRQKS